MNVAIIGMGSIGRRHYENVKAIGHTPVGCDIGDTIPPDADAYMVCVPTDKHLDVLRIIAGFGKPVFLEKPVASVEWHIDEIYQLSLHPVNMVACNLRFSRSVEMMKGLVDSSKQTPISFYAYVMDSNPNRAKYAEELPLQDIHEFDYLSWLFGDLKDLRIDFNPDKTSYHAYLDFGHVQGVIHGNRLAKKYQRGCKIVLENSTVDTEVIVDGSMYEDEVRYFLECVKDNVTPMNSIREACHLTKQVIDVVRGLYHTSTINVY